jgi:sugar fermentation stimulation protein A
MRFQTPLVQARLIRRYKRFLADMRLADGMQVTAHCANPGAMTGMAEPGALCWLAPAGGSGRKLDWSWKLVMTATGLAVVDTGLANRVVAETLARQGIAALDVAGFRPEVAMGARSRVDFMLDDTDKNQTALEVKSVTLVRDDWAVFPDARTVRGTRHLDDLAARARAGQGAAMLYVLMRDGPQQLRIAADIDPDYARAFDAARTAGVRMLAHSTLITPEGIELGAAAGIDPKPQAPDRQTQVQPDAPVLSACEAVRRKT